MTAEKVHTFGEGKALLGLVTPPDEPRPGAPAIIILNAGLVHRAGPFRMSVELARRLARLGHVVLRFDQSGLGDSLQRAGGYSYEERAVLDAREAMDFLTERYGADRFMIVGLCSGAMNAHRIAVADERVVGASLLDGYAYRTLGYWRHMLLPFLADERAWRALRRKVERRIEAHLGRGAPQGGAPDDGRAAPAGEGPGDESFDIFTQSWPTRESVRGEITQILARGARMLFVYSGGWSDYVFADQFHEMFPDLPNRDRIRVEFLPDADHTYILREHREELITRIERFARDLTR